MSCQRRLGRSGFRSLNLEEFETLECVLCRGRETVAKAKQATHPVTQSSRGPALPRNGGIAHRTFRVAFLQSTLGVLAVAHFFSISDMGLSFLGGAADFVGGAGFFSQTQEHCFPNRY